MKTNRNQLVFVLAALLVSVAPAYTTPAHALLQAQTLPQTPPQSKPKTLPVAPSPEMTETVDASRIDVEDVAEAFVDSWNRHDMNALSQLFSVNAEFVNVVGMWWKGREEIKRAHMATHETMFKNSVLKMPKVAVRFLKPDVAIARVSWILTGHTDPAGQPLPRRTGLLVFVLTKSGNQWYIVDAQNTDIIEGVLSTPQTGAK